MTTIAAAVVAFSFFWATGRWIYRRTDHDLGVMSQQWMTEQRLSQQPDPQR